jgi:hypothetical protein
VDLDSTPHYAKKRRIRNNRGTTEDMWHKHGKHLAKHEKVRKILEKLLLRIQEFPG